MMKRWTALFVGAALVAILMAGCGAGGLIGLLMTLIQAGDAITQVDDLLGGDDPETLRVLLDGQELPVVPADDGSLVLSGLPEGSHLLQLVAANRFRGTVSNIDVLADARVNIPEQTPIIGGRIRGMVELGSTPARRVMVVAIPGGAGTVEKAKAAPITIPPTGTYYAAFTDGNGAYSLDAVEPGEYLLTAAMAGYMADVKLVNIPAPRRTVDHNLALVQDASSPFGTLNGAVRGTILGGTQSLANARLTAVCGVAYEPVVPQTVIDAIGTASGLELSDSPWFRWTELATLTDAGGGYQLRAAPGATRLDCFAYDYRPGFKNVQVANGVNTTTEFDLQPR